MKHALLCGACIAIVSGVLTARPVAMQDQQGTSAPQAKNNDEEITAVGCLRRIDTSGHRPATTGSTPPGTSYKAESGFALKQAAILKDGKPVGVAPEREFGLAVKDVKLDGFDKQFVEIKGRFVPDDQPPGGKKADTPEASDLRSLTVGGNDILVSAIRTLKPGCAPDVP